MDAARRPPLPPGPFLVVGLARSGQAIAAVLAERGEQVIAVDSGDPELGSLPEQVEVRLNDDGVSALDQVNTVVKSPGVPQSAPVIVQARSRPGITVVGELDLAFRLVDVPVVAVTGTNGKTTTVELLGHILRTAGTNVAVVGNVGTPYSSLALRGSPRPDLVVCEASSFQLEDSEAFAPETAVLLNLGSDHLDRYGSTEAYQAAKLTMFGAQRPEDLAVVPSLLRDRVAAGPARVMCFGAERGIEMEISDDFLLWRRDPVIGLDEIGIAGPHNAENAAAAALVALERDVDPTVVAQALRSFAGVPHRLEPVADLDGVVWVNDSKATNVAAATVALRSFPGRPLHVILGGGGKGEDYSPLREPLAAHARHAYVIGEQGPVIAVAISSSVEVTECVTLDRAVAAARESARAGDVVLLAPACTSYDQFRDFEERGQVFRTLARTTV